MIPANTNMQSLHLQSCLEKNTNVVQQALERMSTGYKINKAADDAAGYYVATNLNTQLLGLQVANKNIADGNAILNIAEGSLSGINDLLLRIRDLALQSANSVYGDSERNAMQLEVNSLLEEITRIKNAATYNGRNLFGLQTVIDANETYTDNDGPINTIETLSADYHPAVTLSSKTAKSRAMMAYAEVNTTETEEELKPIETGTLKIAAGSTNTLTFGVASFRFNTSTLHSISNPTVEISYKYDPNTGEVVIDGSDYDITALTTDEANITFNGNYVKYTSVNNAKNTLEFNGNNCTISSATTSIMDVTLNGNNNLFNGSTNNGDVVKIGEKATNNYVLAKGGNNDIRILGGSQNYIITGDGDNYVDVSGKLNYVCTGSGNDTFVVNEGASNNVIDGHGGTNTITDNGTDTGKINITGQPTTMPANGRFGFIDKETKDIELFGKIYKFENVGTRRSLAYSYNEKTGEITFSCSGFIITAADNQEDKLILSGSNNVVNTGDKDDTVTITNGGRNTINAGDGDDTVNLNSSSSNNAVYGQAGNDTINVRTSNNYVQDGEGSNNINVLNGSYNIINELNSSSNVITDKSTTTGYINSPSHPDAKLPSRGTLSILAGETMDITLATSLGDKTYTIKNTSAIAGTFAYVVENDGGVSFTSSGYNLQISSANNQENKVKINGSNITYQGSNLKDIITITGTWNNIYGNDGDDEIMNNGDYNQVNGGKGDDKIYLNSTTTRPVTGGDGDDYIEVNKANNTNITGGNGNDTIVINSTGNTVRGGADNDTITMNASDNNVYGESGDDIININAENLQHVASGGDGNDKIYINSSNAGGISGGNGDDYFYTKAGTTGNLVNGGAGTNTLEDYGTNTGTVNIQNRIDKIGNSGTLVFEPNQKLTNITIGDKTYTITNRVGNAETLIYAYNESNGEITFRGNNFKIEDTGNNQEDKIFVYGNYNYIYTYGGNDEVTIQSGVGNQIYGGIGDDKITMNSANNNLYGEDGNDTIVVNAANSSSYTIDGGNNNDRIIVNADNTTLNGGSGDDTFVNNGKNNTLKGGAGNNILDENGSATIRDSISVVNAQKIPSSLLVKANETVTLNINGQTYSITNKNSNDSNFGYDIKNGVIKFSCSNFEITSSTNQNDKISISGNNNVINAINGQNNITIESGTENTVNGGSESDTIIMNSNNNNIYGNDGNDTIILNGANDDAHIVDAGSGSDSVTINSSGNTSVSGGDGSDNIYVNGNNNSITGAAGDDIFTISGSNNIVSGADGNDTFTNNGKNNTINGDGDYNTFLENGENSTLNNIDRVVLLNKKGSILMQAGASMDYVIDGKTYTITNNDSAVKTIEYSASGTELTITADDILIASAADQTCNLKIQGDNNNVVTSNQNDMVKIYGNNNNVETGDGNDTLLISGDNNTVNAQGGDDTLTLINGDSNILDGGTGNNILIKNGTNSTYTGFNQKQEIAKPFSLQVGANSDASSRIDIDIGFMMPFVDLNISSPENAINALNDIDSFLNDIQETMTKIGAYQNRLESVLDSNVIKIENLTAAKSTIMDADIAEESADYTKGTILQNVTATLLAQANRLPSDSIYRLLSGL